VTLQTSSSAIAGYNDGQGGAVNGPSGAFNDFHIHLNITGTGAVAEYTYRYVPTGSSGMIIILPTSISLADGLVEGSDSYYNSTSILQESYTYLSPFPAVANIYGTGVTDAVYPLATDTTYVTASGALTSTDSPATPTTSYSYVYYPGTLQPESVVNTLPVVPNDHGGSGVAAQTVDF